MILARAALKSLAVNSPCVAIQLSEQLAHQKVMIRKEARCLLQSLGMAAMPTVPKLMQLYKHTDETIRFETVAVLEELCCVAAAQRTREHRAERKLLVEFE